MAKQSIKTTEPKLDVVKCVYNAATLGILTRLTPKPKDEVVYEVERKLKGTSVNPLIGEIYFDKKTGVVVSTKPEGLKINKFGDS